MDAEPPSLGPRIPHGASLQELKARGDAYDLFQLAPESILVRPTPFYEETIEPGVAPFADEFHNEARRTGTTGPVSLFLLRSVVVLGGDGICVHKGHVVWNSMRSIQPWHAESLIAQPDDGGQLVLKHRVALPPATSTPLVLGFVGAWRNYAHWITECLPRVLGFLQLRAHVPDAKLLLPALSQDGPQFATLRRLGIGMDDIVMLRNDEIIHASQLWMIHEIDVWHPSPICRSAALRLSTCVPLSEEEADGRLPESLYIQRGMAVRRLLNFQEIRPIIDSFGFVVVRMQEWAVDDQIRMMRNARLIVGENSGGIANVMFCRRGIRLLELNNPAFPQPAHWALAGLLPADYGYCVGQHVGPDKPGMNSDYTIRPSRFLEAMKALTRMS